MLSRVIKSLLVHVSSGVTTAHLNDLATSYIAEVGGKPSFTTVPGYSWATCMSVNEVVVHGIPNNYVLKDGDVLKLDIGIFHKGYHIDYGDTLVIGSVESSIKKFLDVGRGALKGALALVKKGVAVGAVSEYIEKSIYGAGYKTIVELTGHGVGEELHMEPYIPGYKRSAPRAAFKANNAYAIEIIYSMKDNHVVEANNDGWSLKTKSGSMSACFENTIFVTDTDGIVLV